MFRAREVEQSHLSIVSAGAISFPQARVASESVMLKYINAPKWISSAKYLVLSQVPGSRTSARRVPALPGRVFCPSTSILAMSSGRKSYMSILPPILDSENTGVSITMPSFVPGAVNHTPEASE